MPTEPGKGRPARRRPPAKPKQDDGFVVFVVDGFAQLTPEQRTWPVVAFGPPSLATDPSPKGPDETTETT